LSKLTEQHIKLLELYRRNEYTIQQLAEKSGFTSAYINDLIVNNANTGEIGKLFQTELKKVNKDIESRISWKNNTCREKLVNRLIQWTELATADNCDTKTRHKMLVDAINALNKAMPYQVNIENYTWKEGMTTEEAVNEFKRIKGLARAASIRRRVSEFAARGTEQGIVPDGQIGSADAQDTVLPSESETEELSRKSLLDESDIRGK
jgi:uncharacterized membrane protein YheB (UPF0754 family)